jgi:hypothetical protein
LALPVDTTGHRSDGERQKCRMQDAERRMQNSITAIRHPPSAISPHHAFL